MFYMVSLGLCRGAAAAAAPAAATQSRKRKTNLGTNRTSTHLGRIKHIKKHTYHTNMIYNNK